MQWNATSPFLQNIGYDPFSVSKAPSYPQIMGEGDVISVVLPDGTIQLYFVPTNRHITLSPFQYNTIFPNLHCNANKDIWFVRSISHPLPPNLLNRPTPNVYGDQQPPPQFNPNFCINSPPCRDYYQKFHHDDSSSTTDIHYFYPSLRNTGCLKYSTEIQTEPVWINNTNVLDRYPDHCGCRSAETVVKNNLNTKGDASESSTSYMSVDSASQSKHRLTKRNKKKSKSKANKSSDHSCYCDVETNESKYKSNKSRDHSSDFDLETKKSKHKSNKSRDHSCHCDVETKMSKYKSNKSRDHSSDFDLETKKSKYKSNKSRDHSCHCDVETKKSKYKSNKSRDHSCHFDLETKKSKDKSNKSKDYSCDFDVEGKKSKHKSTESLCEYNSENKHTSDKLVTTYAEQASGSTVKDGRHTQTVENKGKCSDISIELWEPINCTSNSTLKLITCSSECMCRSTSGTDDNE